MKALCIVDMQTGFDTSKSALEGVLEQIELFKQHKQPIILVEFRSYGQTLQPILDALKGYPVVNVQKCADDGGEEVQGNIKYCNGPVKEIVMCGVNTCYCVGSTALTLSKMGYNVSISPKATGCMDYHRIEHCIRDVSSGLRINRMTTRWQTWKSKILSTLFPRKASKNC